MVKFYLPFILVFSLFFNLFEVSGNSFKDGSDDLAYKFRAPEFITTWKTDNPGPSNNNQIVIPTRGTLTYNYNVDWGDGTSSNETGDATHTYANPGIYTVKISGTFPTIYFLNASDRSKILSVEQWGAIEWESLQYSFYGCNNLQIPATDIPNLSFANSIYGAFYACANLNSPSIGNWDVSTISDMGAVFTNCTSFNQDLSEWNTANAINMSSLFNSATSFDQDLSAWDIGSVTKFLSIFDHSGLSTRNYDKILNAWSTKTTVTSLAFGAEGIEFCNSSGSRQQLIDTQSWQFEGDTQNCKSFVTTWITDNEGVSSDNQITIPTNSSYVYNYTVDWGDGNSTSHTGNATHTYATAGKYTVSISGEFPSIYFADQGDRLKLTSVDQWGDIEWATMESAFSGCENLRIDAVDSPNLDNVLSLEDMFANNIVMNDNINHWDVSNVQIFFRTFKGASAFNQPLNNWDLSSAITIQEMFAFARNFNQPLNNWNTPNLDNVAYTFWEASSFNQQVNNWNVSSVVNMDAVFLDAVSFDQDLSAWDIGSSTIFNSIFNNTALSTKNYDLILNSWANKTSATNRQFGANGLNYCNGEDARAYLTNDLGWSFVGDSRLCNPFITTWKTDNQGTSNNNQITIPTNSSLTYNYVVDWGDETTSTETGDATHTYDSPGTYTVSISGDFPTIYFADQGDKFKILSVNQWGDNPWQSLDYSFQGCQNLIVSASDVPNLTQATSIFAIFASCRNLNSTSISDWDVSPISDFGGAFFGCEIFNQDLSQWDVSSATSFSQMFQFATNFDQDLSSWDISNVNNMNSSFTQSGVSVENYDRILNAWSSQTVQPNVAVGVDGLTYCDGQEGKQILETKGWDFTGDSRECLPFARYDFNGNTNDNTNNGYDGEPTNILLTPDRFSIPDQAYQFNTQQASRIDLENTIGDDNLSGNFSISAWINPSEFDGENTIVANHDQNAGFGLLLSDVGSTNPDELKVDLFGGTGINGGIVSQNQWNHVVMTFSPSKGVKLYLNGELTAEHNEVINIDLSESTAPISIGNHDFHGVLNGKIDDVSLYNKYLLIEDVLEIYEEGNWPLEKIAQYDFVGNANDVTGNGYDGTVDVATLTTDRFNKIDSAYNFSSGKITTAAVPVYDQITLATWFRTNTDYSAGYRSIVDVEGTGALAIGSNNQLEASLQIGTDNFVVLNSGFAVNDGDWHLATMTYDGDEFNLYLDDSLVNTNSYNEAMSFYANPTPINIGFRIENGSDLYFGGDIDDVKYYSFALNEFQVEDLFGERGFVLKPTAGPVNPNLLVINNTALRFNFEPANQDVDGYIAVRSTNGFVNDEFLVDGQTYENYDFTESLDAYVIYPDLNDTTITDSDTNFPLASQTEYFYKVWSYNGEGSNIKYSNANTMPYSRSTLTDPTTDQAKNLQISEVTPSSMQINFTASEDQNVTGYLVTVAPIIDGPLPNYGGELFVESPMNIGDFIGDFRIAAIGTDLSALIDGLTPATRQYIDVYTITGTGNTAFYNFSDRNLSRLTLPQEPANVLQDFTVSNPSESGYTISFEDSNSETFEFESLFTQEKENADFISPLAYIGVESFYNPVQIGEFANGNSVEIRFGNGKSQKAHRFLVPEGATSGVADLNYSYQDYVDVPFEVWDIDRNIQLNVSFRDQDRNGVFNLLEYNVTGAPNEQSREYLYISDTEYDQANSDTNIAVNGGHIYRRMYQNWLNLTAGFTWDANALPEAILRYAYYNKNSTGYLVIKNSSEAPVDGRIYKLGDAIGGGEVHYLGTDTGFTEENLAANTESQYSVYAFRGAGLFTNYQQTNFLSGSASTLAAEPLNQALDLTFNDVTASGLNVNFNSAADNPDNYLVLRKLGQTITEIPIDGQPYTVGDQIGDAVVAYVGANNQFEESILDANTEYYYAVFSYNGSNLSSNYLLSNPLENAVLTLFPEPTDQPSDLTFTDRTSSSFMVNFSSSDENASFIALRTAGESVPDSAPQDGLSYAVNDQIGNATVAYVGTETSFSEVQLDVLTNYNYQIFAFNGTEDKVNYLAVNPLAGAVSTLANEPNSQATNLSFAERTSSSITVNFDASEENVSFIALRTDGENTPTIEPEDGISYNLNDQIGNAMVVYVGDQTSFSESGLQAGTQYSYYIYASIGQENFVNYLVLDPLAGSFTTFSEEPLNQATDLVFTDITSDSYTVSFSSSDGNASFLAIRSEGGGVPDTAPEDGITYSVNDVIGNAVIAYVGDQLSFSESGLQSNTTYTYQIYAFNGQDSESNYLLANPLEGSLSTLFEQPLDQPTDIIFTDRSPNSFSVNFSSATENLSFIALRTEGEVFPDTAPEDANQYEIGGQIGNAVVAYVGNQTSFSQGQLEASTVYNFHIYAFNGSGDVANYLLTSPLEGSTNTFATEPASSPESLEFTDIGSNSVTVSFTEGSSDADGYLVLRHTEEQFTGVILDGTDYETGTPLGNSQVVYNGPGFNFSDVDLDAGTLYRYIVFSYNGAADSINYLTTNSLTGFFKTLSTEPGSQGSSISFSDITVSSLVLNFVAASDNPNGYLVVMREGSTPESLPVDGNSYIIGDFLDVDNNEQVISVSSETSISIENLLFNTEYHFAIYSYNGNEDFTNYNTTLPLTGSMSTLEDNSAPNIANISYPNTVDLGNEILIQVDVDDPETSIVSVQIEYINSSVGNYDNATSEEMSSSGNTYSYTILNQSVEGTEFRIIAENSIGLFSTTQSFPVLTNITNEGLTIPYNAFGAEQSNYRIVSIPLDLTNKTVNSVFGQQLGDYGDASIWRMFRYNNGSIGELTGSSQLSPGNGYWLIANATDVTFNTGTGSLVSSSIESPFEIELQSGWNQIGNPYTFDVAWNTILDFNDQDLELRVFDGSWKNSSTLSVFSGGFVFWPEDSNFSLKIPKGNISTSQSRTDNSKDEGESWFLPLEISSENVVNTLNGIGMADDASDGIDSKDQFNLPLFMEYVQLSHQISRFNYTLSSSVVQSKENHTWVFDLKSNGDAKSISLKWSEISELHQLNFKNMVLFDPIRNSIIDMQEVYSYDFNSQDVAGVKIIYGNERYIQDQLEINKVQFYDPFPNPSEAFFNLSYFIPKKLSGAALQFDLLDIRGNQISSKNYNLINEGFHQLEWNLKEELNNISSGLYIINMTVNHEIKIQKKIFIRD